MNKTQEHKDAAVKAYKPLTLPTFSWNTARSKVSFGELVVEPLEPGYGITFGNALRRTMLSSVEGAAVTSIVIAGVNNEFTTLDGVIEDVVQIVLNIKDIIVRNKTGEPGTMRLHKTGEGPVKVGDVETDAHLEVINKDHVLAHLAADGELEIEFFVEMGRGYQPAQWDPTHPIQKDGRIYLDASFSPVRRVAYKIEKVRVGESIDHDRLVLDVETDASVSPQDAVYYATSVLRTQFEHFLTVPEIPFNEISRQSVVEEQNEQIEDVVGPTKGLPVELFLKPIDELEFSVRAHNCLVSAGIKRVIDLVNLTEDEILKIKNFGRKSLREVKEILKAFDLHLGMNIKEVDLKKMIKQQEDGLKS